MICQVCGRDVRVRIDGGLYAHVDEGKTCPGSGRRPILAPELKRLREQCGWSQEELAQVLGRARSSIVHWERGTAPIPEQIGPGLRHAALRIARAREAYERVRAEEARNLPTYVNSHWKNAT